VSNVLVSTMDIFPTALAAAGVALPSTYRIDGRDMTPVLANPLGSQTQHAVFLHYCGFRIIGARVWGRWKVFWATQRWYTFDPPNASICNECCNGVNAAGVAVAGVHATQLCGCDDSALTTYDAPIIYDLETDVMEEKPLTNATWPSSAGVGYDAIVRLAVQARDAMEAELHPSPSVGGGGTCTAGLPSPARQPCCPGCHKKVGVPSCLADATDDDECECNLLAGVATLLSSPLESPRSHSPPLTDPLPLSDRTHRSG